MWDSYLVQGQWKQAHFDSSVSFLLNTNEREECEHFADQFFDKVEFVEQNFHRDFFESWFSSLCPSFLRRPGDLAKYTELLAKYENCTDKTLFVNLLKDQVDSMENLIEMAKKNKIDGAR